MSQATDRLPAPGAPVPPAGASARQASPWLRNPWFDLLLVCNLAWPIVVLALVPATLEIRQQAGALVFFLLNTPHRWVTLPLVFLDPDVLGSRKSTFIGILVTAIVGTSAVFAITGELLWLVRLHLVWVAWHFAAQHSGILRMYGVLTRPGEAAAPYTYEKWSLRLTVLWAFASIGFGTPQMGGELLLGVPIGAWLAADVLFLLLPVGILVDEIRRFERTTIARLAYVTSVLGMYVAVVLSYRLGHDALFAATVIATGLFHACEYLAIVTWSLGNRKGLRGPIQTIWRFWAVSLGTYMTVLMVSGVVLANFVPQAVVAWSFVNLIVSYVHYAYDGIIWKKPNKRPSAVPA